MYSATQKSEVGSQKLEVGSWKSEVGSRKLEVGSWKSEVRTQKFDSRTRLHYVFILFHIFIGYSFSNMILGSMLSKAVTMTYSFDQFDIFHRQ